MTIQINIRKRFERLKIKHAMMSTTSRWQTEIETEGGNRRV